MSKLGRYVQGPGKEGVDAGFEFNYSCAGGVKIKSPGSAGNHNYIGVQYPYNFNNIIGHLYLHLENRWNGH